MLIRTILFLLLLTEAAHAQFAHPATWTIRAKSTSSVEGPTDAICLVRCVDGGEVTCATPSASGEVAFTVGPEGCLRAVARNTAGSSGPSAETAWAKEWAVGDCNRDGAVSVSDIICVNLEIFHQ
jgi:hypothetical protein